MFCFQDKWYRTVVVMMIKGLGQVGEIHSHCQMIYVTTLHFVSIKQRPMMEKN